MNKQKADFFKKHRKEIVHRFYDDFAKDYDKNRYGLEEQKITGEITEQVVSEFVGDVRNKSILDCGCGTGRLVDFFTKKGAKITGMDISENMLKIAKEKIPTATFVKGDILSLPFKEKVFDVVICSEVLTHLHIYKKPLLEMKRVLKDDGTIIIDIRNVLWPYRLLKMLKRVIEKSNKEYYPHYTLIWKIKRICNKIGLKIDEFKGVGLSFGSRGIKRVKKEIKRSGSKLKYIAPTLILKITKSQ